MGNAHYASLSVDGFDAEALLGVVKDTRFEQRLLHGGDFHAHVQRINFGAFSLDCGDYSLPVFASGSFGRDVVALALGLRCVQPMWANGRSVERGRLMVFAENHELDVRPALGHWRWAVLLIGRELLLEQAHYRHGRVPEIPQRGWRLLAMPRAGNAPLCGLLWRVLQRAACWTARTPLSEVQMAGQQVLAGFVDAAMAGVQPPPMSPWMRDGHQRLLVRRAEQFLEDRAGGEFSLAGLALALGIGERQTERLFRAAFDMGPLRWYQIARLNQARQRLQQSEGAVQVTEVAGRLGFNHLGRFAMEYRKLFGESPRDTLASARDSFLLGRFTEPTTAPERGFPRIPA